MTGMKYLPTSNQSQRDKIQVTPSRVAGRKKVVRRLLRRHLDMPDPRGLSLGPILRGEHVFAIYLGPSAIQQALGPPPDHQMYVPCRWGGSWGAQRPHQPGPTSVTCVCVCARRVAPF